MLKLGDKLYKENILKRIAKKLKKDEVLSVVWSIQSLITVCSLFTVRGKALVIVLMLYLLTSLLVFIEGEM